MVTTMHRFSPGHLLRNRDALFGLLLLLATLTAYYPAWNGRPIWDDDRHMTAPVLRSFAGLEHIWTRLGATQQYYPLAHSVFWLEYRLWGDAPLGYHLLNIMLHALSAFLLYKILRQLAIPGAWFVAALFALHPIEVESVAWISELKNCLSGVFFFAAVYSYLRFDETRTKRPYIFSFIFFALGLMAKTAIAPMPAAMLVILWWKRGSGGKLSWKNDLLPLLPFFIAGVSFGLFTAWVERRVIIGREDFSFGYSAVGRSLIAGRAFWFYLGKLFVPRTLIFSYPRWAVSAAAWQQYLYPAAAAALGVFLVIYRRQSRAPLAAALFYGVMLFPALGFFNIYPFRYSFVADHFQYLAGIGPIVLFAALSTSALSRMKNRYSLVAWVIPAMLLLACFAVTRHQSAMYSDVETLYRTILEKNPSSGLAWNNLGISYLEKGRTDDAADCFHRALDLNPKDYLALNNLGILSSNLGRREEAIAQFRSAIAAWPGYDIAWCNLGNALAGAGRPGVAIDCYRKAVDLNPGYVEALVNLGSTLVMSGSAEEGIAMFRRALEVDPGNEAALLNEGHALQIIGRSAEAIGCFRKVLAQSPGEVTMLNDLCGIFMQLHDADDAIGAAERAMAVAKATGQEALAREIAGNIEEMKQGRSQEPGGRSQESGGRKRSDKVTE
jgi:tetratricopeptide (TPR) repeat protein